MNGTNGNEPGYPENALVPYPVIVAATKGDPDAMKIVLQHFSGYIARLSNTYHLDCGEKSQTESLPLFCRRSLSGRRTFSLRQYQPKRLRRKRKLLSRKSDGQRCHYRHPYYGYAKRTSSRPDE